MTASFKYEDWVSVYYYDLPAELARRRAELERKKALLVETAPVNLDLDALLTRLVEVNALLEAIKTLQSEVKENGSDLGTTGYD